MKSRHLLAVIASFPLLVHGQLPKESAELITQLKDWELDQQAELQQQIKKKRKEVAAVLEGHLVEATKAGNLDGALAIREEIKKVKEQLLTTAPNGFIGRTYTRPVAMKGAKSMSVRFNEGGKAVMTTFWTGKKAVTKPATWRKLESGVVLLTVDGSERYWTFAPDSETAVARVGTGGPPINAKASD